MSFHLQWDIFCKVIDNYGDIGVCWRLARDLAQRKGHSVRLWVDDASALQWMATDAELGLPIEVLMWNAQSLASCESRLQSQPTDVLIEAFGCEIAIEMIAARARIHWSGGTFNTKKEPFLPVFLPLEPLQAAPTVKTPHWPVWINLEYLTAEPYAARCHGLTSPVQHGPGKGQSKYFYYPGFNQGTGGLLREPGLLAEQAAFDVPAWRLAQDTVAQKGAVWISLFCYEPLALAAFVKHLAQHGFAGRPVQLCVTAGRATQAVQQVLKLPDFEHQKCLQPNESVHGQLSILYLPLLSQHGYDRLLWACDFNCVRGEDSLVRAVWAGKPFLWQAYPQEGDAQFAKVDALMEALDVLPALWTLHRVWNGKNHCVHAKLPTLPLPADKSAWADWQASALAAQARLVKREDLTTQLIAFARKKADAIF